MRAMFNKPLRDLKVIQERRLSIYFIEMLEGSKNPNCVSDATKLLTKVKVFKAEKAPKVYKRKGPNEEDKKKG